MDVDFIPAGKLRQMENEKQLSSLLPLRSFPVLFPYSCVR